MLKSIRANIKVIFLLLGMAVISTGCQTVNVKDTDGKAIAFAHVSSGVQGSKFASSSVLTDGLGNAFIAKGSTESKNQWVAVSKEGYTSRRILRPAEGTIEVVLTKATSSGMRYQSSRAVTSSGMSDTTRYRSTPSANTPSSNAKVIVPRK